MTELVDPTISAPSEETTRLLQVELNLKLPEDVNPVPVPNDTSSVFIATEPPPHPPDIVDASLYLT